MKYLIYSLLTFVIVYLLYELLLVRRKNKINNIYKSTEVENYQQEDGSVVIPEVLRPYMGVDKIEAKKLTRIIALINAFILSITLEIILVVTSKIILQMLLGFVILLVLICIIYPIIAIILRKKYGKF